MTTTSSDTTLAQLVINELTQAEYAALTPQPNQLYLVSDEGLFDNIGTIITSIIPLTDAGLHLLDGSLIYGNGIYSSFVDYIAELYNDDPTASYFAQGYSTYENMTSEGTEISGGNYSGQPLSNAFDNDVTTYWGSSQLGSGNIIGTAYIGRSGLTHPVKKVKLYQGHPSYITNYCTGLKFQYSNDGSTWVDIDTITNGADKTWQEWVLPDYTPTGSTHSFRILANGGFSGGTSNNWIVDELQLYYSYNRLPEEEWQTAVSTYGVCGKFVYDSVNNTVRLPKYNSKIFTGGGEASVKGNGMALGLTDGTYNAGLRHFTTNNATRLGSNRTAYGEPVGGGVTGSTMLKDSINAGITTDGTKSGIIADLANITTSLDGYWYIVIATTTKTAIEVDIDEVATDLNGKADTDLTNVSNTAGFRKLIDLGNNGTAGYKIFREYNPSTGNYVGLWCEEWGETGTTSGQRNITFTNTFKDTNYNASFCWSTMTTFNTSNIVVQNMALVNASQTGFSVKTGVTIPIRWKVSGYLEEV